MVQYCKALGGRPGNSVVDFRQTLVLKKNSRTEKFAYFYLCIQRKRNDGHICIAYQRKKEMAPRFLKHIKPINVSLPYESNFCLAELFGI